MANPENWKKSNTIGFTFIQILSRQIHANFVNFNERGLVAVLEF